MKLRPGICAVLLALASSVASANHCPMDMKAIDEALGQHPSLTTAQLEQVTKLRAEGEAFHKAGKHRESMEALGQARKILGI